MRFHTMSKNESKYTVIKEKFGSKLTSCFRKKSTWVILCTCILKGAVVDSTCLWSCMTDISVTIFHFHRWQLSLDPIITLSLNDWFPCRRFNNYRRINRLPTTDINYDATEDLKINYSICLILAFSSNQLTLFNFYKCLSITGIVKQSQQDEVVLQPIHTDWSVNFHL